ncbi:MAG: PEGA domain-containing protein [Myxococcales bacterium]|nr:PEGA domain-containing protein [Myxococcales bacterium]
MNARVGMVIGLVVMVLGLVAFGVWRWSGSSEAPTRPGTLSILSSPAGAKISIEGKVVGKTPWFSDNTWPRKPVLFELSLPGYRTWKGSFSGGVEARMNVTLSRRKPRRVSDAGVIDGGSMDIDLDDEEDDGPLHTRGPLRPPEPTEFVDEDLDREAAAAKGAK